MDEGLYNSDHRADFIDCRSPTAMSGGASGAHKNLQSLFFVQAYSAVGAETT